MFASLSGLVQGWKTTNRLLDLFTRFPRLVYQSLYAAASLLRLCCKPDYPILCKGATLTGKQGSSG